jgi:uncharacterized protein (DUF58 family)
VPNLLLIGIGLVFFAASFRVSFFYYILYFFIIVALLARFWIWRAWRTLEIRRDFDDHAFLDETVTLRLRVRNGGRLPLPWVRVEDRLPTRLVGYWRTGSGDREQQAGKAPGGGGESGRQAGRDAYRAVVSLLAGETRTLEYSVYASRRGYYPIGPLSVDLGDVFGFYGRSLRTAMPAFLTVYPRIVSLEQLGLPSKSPFGSLRTTEIIFEDPSRVSGVRDYFRGDSLRKVNWKVSAALGRLQVKTYEPAITLDTMLVLNLDQEEYDLAYADGAMELAITTAASLANHLAGLRQPFGLLCNGRDAAARYRSADARQAATPVPTAAGGGAADDAAGAGEDEGEEPEAPRGLSAPQPWEIDRRGVDELGFATTGSQATSRLRPALVVPPGKGRAHLMRVMETLARAQSRNGYPLASLLRQQSVRLPWGSTIVVVTWGRAMGLVEALVNLRKGGYTIVLVLVRFGMRDTFPSEMAALGFQVHEVRSEQDATLFDQRRVRVAV